MTFSENFSDWLKNPINRLSVIIGMAGIALLLLLFFQFNKTNILQQRQIKSLEEKISLIWPPPKTPITIASDEEDWGKVLEELSKKQKIYWYQRLAKTVNNMPEGVWLSGIYLSTNNEHALISEQEGWLIQPGDGLTMEGRIHSTATDEHLENISLYIQRNLADPESGDKNNNWKFVSLQRMDEQTIAFDAHCPIQ